MFNSLFGIANTAQERVMNTMDLMLAPVRFVIDALILMLMIMVIIPTLIICWCFYHPALAHFYFANAIPVLWNGGLATQLVLVFFVLLVLTLFKATKKIAKTILWSAIVVGVCFYIYKIF